MAAPEIPTGSFPPAFPGRACHGPDKADPDEMQWGWGKTLTRCRPGPDDAGWSAQVVVVWAVDRLSIEWVGAERLRPAVQVNDVPT